MNEIEGVAVMFLVTILGMFFVLYTGQSTVKRTGLTMKQTIDAFPLPIRMAFWTGILMMVVFSIGLILS